MSYSDEVQHDCFANHGFSRVGVVLMKYPVKVHMNPCIVISAISGKTYAVAGQWVEVPDGTTLADVHKYVTYVKPTYDIKTWKVKSSSGSTYTVSRINGKLKCNCPGFRWRQKCKHTTKVNNEKR